MHCDELVALDPGAEGKPYPVGLPEAGLGICPGWGGANMLPARIAPGRAIELTASGKPLKVGEMIEAGLFAGTAGDKDAVLALAKERALRPRADRGGAGPKNISWGRGAGSGPVRAALESVSVPETKAAAGVVGCVRAGLDGGWPAGLAAEKDTLIALRGTEEARAALGAFFAKNNQKAGTKPGGQKAGTKSRA